MCVCVNAGVCGRGIMCGWMERSSKHAFQESSSSIRSSRSSRSSTPTPPQHSHPPVHGRHRAAGGLRQAAPIVAALVPVGIPQPGVKWLPACSTLTPNPNSNPNPNPNPNLNHSQGVRASSGTCEPHENSVWRGAGGRSGEQGGRGASTPQLNAAHFLSCLSWADSGDPAFPVGPLNSQQAQGRGCAPSQLPTAGLYPQAQGLCPHLSTGVPAPTLARGVPNASPSPGVVCPCWPCAHHMATKLSSGGLHPSSPSPHAAPPGWHRLFLSFPWMHILF